ncbi:MAG: FKBP-type peptidyl-prolyl cis-trans isomerase [Propionibacteriaceae bacterium]|nr:FKBP-type peptidyl-prolyl cis-trans isomerase [Propionibacteriaceae bacterium]
MSAVSVTLLTVACSGTGPAPASTSAPSADPAATATASPRPSIAPSADLSGIEVSDADTPELKVPAPWAIEKTTVKVLREGTSAQVVSQSGAVRVNYVGVNGRTGEIFDSSFERGAPADFAVNGVIKGFNQALVGQKVGSRVLVGITSEDGYPQGSGDKILAGDHLVFVLDILAAELEEPVGAAKELPAAAPKVSVGADGPKLEAPTGSAPTELGSYLLIEGTGQPVAVTDTITVRYRSFTWDGAQFEDAWSVKQSGALNQLLQGWQDGLAGKPVGSRVVLAIPPQLGLPNGRKAAPTLPPGQSLIYVIDVLYSVPTPS